MSSELGKVTIGISTNGKLKISAIPNGLFFQLDSEMNLLYRYDYNIQYDKFESEFGCLSCPSSWSGDFDSSCIRKGVDQVEER